MKTILYFILLALLGKKSFSSQRLLGGWSTTTDESLIQDCLQKALVHINGPQVDDHIKSQVSNIVCKTQIVNGLNIKLYFHHREDKWECSFYKSFVQTVDIQLNECKRVEKDHSSQQNINNSDFDDDEANIDTLNQQGHADDERAL